MLRWISSVLGKLVRWMGCCCRNETAEPPKPKRNSAAFTMHGLEDRQHLSLVTISINDVSVLEGNAGQRYAVFAVGLSGLMTTPASVHYTTVNGTAKAGEDYQAVSGSLIFPSGTRGKTITVPINGDTLLEPDETFSVKLTSSIGVTIAKDVGAGWIVDDDRPAINVAARADASEAGAMGVFRITRTGATTSALRVRYGVAGTATSGIDYKKLTRVATIKAGQTFVDVKIAPVADSVQEGDETVVLNLLAHSDYTLGTAISATLKIIDREVVPPTAKLSAKALAKAGGTFYQFSVKYTDNLAMDPGSAGDGDVRVTGPNGYTQNAVLVSATLSRNKKALTAVYRIAAPGGAWDSTDNGVYTVSVRPKQITDTSGNAIAAGGLGTFNVRIA